ncbi:MAG: hypothetical protein JEY94_15070 [Melioribacteraceae bacterium]|nr:hypothetical protein [Melioribacteraceae bacterium]
MILQKTKHIILVNILFICFGVLLSTCESTSPKERNLELALLEASCTEAWLTIKVEKLHSLTEVIVIINTEDKRIFEIENSDTVLCIDSLKPATDYNVTLEIEGTKSRNISFATLATTNNNFTFEKYYLGGETSCYINDVAIIDENNIWAVGDIQVREENGEFSSPYGLTKWNGSEWNLEYVKYCHYPSNTARPGKLKAIFALDKNNIFVASSSQLLKWNNSNWIEKAQFADSYEFDGQINAIWGNATDNIYCVGNNGAIYHYYGTGKKKLPKVTDLDIQDIWGDYDELTGEWEILAIASDRYQNNGRKILKIEGDEVTEQLTDGLPWSLKGIWFKTNRKKIICGNGVYTNNNLSKDWQKETSLPFLYKHSISGQALNSIVLCGAYGLISYYNGEIWESIEHLEKQKYVSVDIKGNLIVAGGQHNNSACITIGRR